MNLEAVLKSINECSHSTVIVEYYFMFRCVPGEKTTSDTQGFCGVEYSIIRPSSSYLFGCVSVHTYKRTNQRKCTVLWLLSLVSGGEYVSSNDGL